MTLVRILTLQLLLLAFVGFFPTHAIALPVEAVQIHKTTHADTQELLDVIPIQKGEQYRPQMLDEAITYLRKWGIFDNIRVTTEEGSEGVILHFYLEDAILVGEINISGNYPLLDSKVRKYLTIRPGDLYTKTRAFDQIEKIKRLYEREGYFGTTVSVEERWSPITQDAIIDYHIDRGFQLHIGQIEVNGHSVFPRGRFVSTINPYRAYDKRRLRDVARKLVQDYRKKGYLKAAVRIEPTHFDMANKEVDVKVDVKEGPQVAIEFTGNTHILSRTLTKQLTFFEIGSFDLIEMEESAKRIRQYYQRQGFPDSEVNFEMEKEREDQWKALFSITEGRRVYIRRIDMDGNEEIPARKIHEQMLTKPLSFSNRGALDRELLSEDLKAIKTFYATKGFLDASVDSPIIEPHEYYTYQLLVTLPLQEGAQIILSKVEFSGNAAFVAKKLETQLKLKVEDPFDPHHMESEQQHLVRYYMDRGYPYVQVTPSVTINGDEAVIHYAIEEGSAVTIGQILITGDSLTSQKSIRNSMSIKEGEPYSHRKILDSEIGLRRTGAFNSVRIETIGLDDKKEEVHLAIKVEEAKPFKMDFDLGFSSDQNITGGLTFLNTNTFGWAKTTSLRLIGGQELSRGELGWLDPRFLGHDLQLANSIWLQYEDSQTFNYLQTGWRISLSRLYHRTGLLVGYELNRNYFVEGSSVAADAESLRNNIISKITTSASFDTRNSFADPTSGIWASSGIAINNEIRGNQANFLKFKENLGYYFTPLHWITFSSEGRLTHIQPIGSHVSVPTNELLFMGGDTTVRGYREDSLGPVDAGGASTGGRTLALFTHEWRLPLFDGMKGALFYDVGTLTNNFQDISTDTVRQSAGFGLRYITPVGPIRADFGFPIDPAPGDPEWRFHFIFGYVF